jgi:sortase A
MNPIFTDDPSQREDDQSYLLPQGQRHITPPHQIRGDANPAADLIRRKIDALYAEEPNARKELQEAEAKRPPRSKHQQYMHDLSMSGRSLAEIQTAWHQYYAGLSDPEKRAVWQEFYSANKQHAPLPPKQTFQQSNVVVSHHETPQATPLPQANDRRSIASIKKQILKHVRASNSAQIKAKQHLQSLAFGVGLGALILLIFLFGLFNEIVITPFIRPSSNVNSATPIILSSEGIAPSANPEVIVPKINVQLPVIYGSQSIKEEDIQNALLNGVYHYPTTALPGQQGNAAYFGHSSNNIFNKGNYKFAFVLLHELEPGDIFYLTHDQKVYAYKVYDKKIVNPTDTWVLNPVPGKAATATLITCDPPGTSLHRLVVWGEQISPDPAVNAIAAAPSPALANEPLPGNGPNALTKIWRALTPF